MNLQTISNDLSTDQSTDESKNISSHLSTGHSAADDKVYAPSALPPPELQYDFTTVPPAIQAKAIKVEDAVALLKSYDWDKQAGLPFWTRILGLPIFAIGVLVSIYLERAGWLACCLFALAGIAVMGYQSDQIELQRFVLKNMGLDKSWLGPMIEALEWPARRVKKTATALLIQMLPRVTEADAGIFTKNRMACLHQHLERSAALKNPELALAILRVLRIVGTNADVPFVQPLTSVPYYSNAQHYSNAQKLQATAHQVVAALQGRAEPAPLWQKTAENPTDMATLQDGAAAPALTLEEQAQHAEAAALVDRQMEEFEAELRKQMTPGMRLGFLIASWGIIFPYCVFQTYMQFANHQWRYGLLFALLTGISTQLYRLTLTDRHKLMAQQLARLDDIRCIGRLTETLEWPDESVRSVAISALTRLLPRVKASDNVLHTPAQRAGLYRMLDLSNARIHADFMLAILKALEQIGDAAAVPIVENLARQKPTFSYERRVCEAAGECLPFLLVRANLNQSSQTLLRGSSAPPTGADILVRAASAVNTTDQDQLLRPGASD